MGGAVAALARIAVALLPQLLSVAVGDDRAERMVAGGARALGDVEGPAQQRLVIGAKGRGGHGKRVYRSTTSARFHITQRRSCPWRLGSW